MIGNFQVYILACIWGVYAGCLNASSAEAAAFSGSGESTATSRAARALPVHSHPCAEKECTDISPDAKVAPHDGGIARAGVGETPEEDTTLPFVWEGKRSSRDMLRTAAHAAAAITRMRTRASVGFFDTPLAPYPLGMDVKRPIFVLSIDGGGIRGVRPAEILAALERRTLDEFGLPLQRIFDIMAGTSTGAGIVSALSLPGATPGESKFRAETLKSLYSPENARRIFQASLGHSICNCWGLTGTRFPDTGIIDVLTEYIGTEKWLSEIATNLLIPTVSLDTGAIKYFRSDRASHDTREDYTLFDAVKASAAAPTFLPTHTVSNRVGDKTVCVDGGVQINNPTLAAYELARELYGTGAEVYIFSIGTGVNATTVTEPASLRHAGKIGWARPVIDLAMGGNALRTDGIMQKILPAPPAGSDELPHYVRSQFTFSPTLADMSSHDPAVIEAVRRTGDPEQTPEVHAMIETLMRIFERHFPAKAT